MPSVPRVELTTVGIVEDDPILREAVAQLVNGIEGLSVLGMASTLTDGLHLAERRLDILLVDLGLPDGNGLELIATIRSRPSTCRILVLSAFGDVYSVVRAIEYGADGYLLKGADMSAVAWAIRTVLAGGAPISPSVAGHILSRVRDHVRGRSAAKALALSLTAKEVKVLDQLAKGLSYKEVAELDGNSYHTVAHHVKNIYRKLSVNSRGEAVYEAVQAGLIQFDGPEPARHPSR